MGGTGSVSGAVQTQLKTAFGSGNVVRIAGADRFETSRLIAEYAFDTAEHAFIATGGNFPDALAAGPAASKLDAPVLLVNGPAAHLDDAIADVLAYLGVDEFYVLGSSSAVSKGVASDLATIADVTRLQGADRYQTALEIVVEFFEESNYAFLATGTNFPDASAEALSRGVSVLRCT